MGDRIDRGRSAYGTPTRLGDDDGIDFAYPTQRFFDNVTEGKPGARASTD